jgi:hypothetical protein
MEIITLVPTALEHYCIGDLKKWNLLYFLVVLIQNLYYT